MNDANKKNISCCV